VATFIDIDKILIILKDLIYKARSLRK